MGGSYGQFDIGHGNTFFPNDLNKRGVFFLEGMNQDHSEMARSYPCVTTKTSMLKWQLLKIGLIGFNSHISYLH